MCVRYCEYLICCLPFAGHAGQNNGRLSAGTGKKKKKVKKKLLGSLCPGPITLSIINTARKVGRVLHYQHGSGGTAVSPVSARPAGQYADGQRSLLSHRSPQGHGPGGSKPRQDGPGADETTDQSFSFMGPSKSRRFFCKTSEQRIAFGLTFRGAVRDGTRRRVVTSVP